MLKQFKVEWAKFFGDPDRLERTFAEESKGTIFCDLDGTVIVHEDSPGRFARNKSIRWSS